MKSSGHKTIGLSALVLFWFFAANLSSQQAIGKWRIHFGYNAATTLAQTADQVFAVSSGALFSVGKTDQSIRQYSKIDGLSDNYINAAVYDKERKQLLLVYDNANIDLLSDDGITNIPQFKDKQSSIDKTINSININGAYAYFACKFGILVINLNKKEIADSYVIGANGTNVSVLSTAILGSKIYALTPTGVMQANLNDHNLSNYQVWNNIASVPNGNNIGLLAFANTLWLLQNGLIYQSVDGINWNIVNGLQNISRIGCDGSKLFFISDTSGSTIAYNSSLQSTTLGIAPPMICYDGQTNEYWYVKGNTDGLTKTDATGKSVNTYKPAGPYDNTAWDMQFAGDKLLVVSGGAWASQYNHPAAVMTYENDNWKVITANDIASQTNMPTLPVYDFVAVAADPNDNGHFFAASYGMGLYEFRKDKFYKWYNSQNSTLESIFPGQNIEMYYQRINGLTFDKAGNVWFSNCEVNNSIKYLTPEGVVKPYLFPDLKKKYNINHILIDQSNPNRKWGNTSRAGASIFAFDDNGTLDNPADDKQRLFTTFTDQDGNTFTSETFLCLAQDKNNQIWIGTSKGPIVIKNPGKAFDATFTITRIKIPRNDGTNYADYFLGTEQVTAIAIDDANRKWIGTSSSGIYLLSDDGQTTINHFNTDNSPLLSNKITSLALNNRTGELFIGTDQGMLSYQTDATAGSFSFDNLYAYPNPVRESYQGLITITGLMTGSIVNITDVAGNLVYRTTSNGGAAVWNGKRAGGKRVATGVYLINAVSPDGNKSGSTKLLIIN